MSEPLVLWIPRPPDNANNRGHWRIAVTAKRAFVADLEWRLLLKLVPPVPATPMSGVVIGSTWHALGRARILDQDNAIRRLKPVLDWLVTKRYLAGDTPQHVTIAPPEQRRVTQLPPEATQLASVRLTITPRAGTGEP